MRTLLILFMLWSLCSPSPRSYIRQYRFPEVVFEIQEITGSCSKEEINAVVDNEMLALRSIYFKYLEKNKKSLADGNILFKFTISKNGEITKADIIHSSTGNVEFDEAVKNRISIWKWNVKNDSATVTILFKFSSTLKLFPIVSNSRKLIEYKEYYPCLFSYFMRLAPIYKKHLEIKPYPRDVKIMIKFNINADGKVTDASIVASTTEDVEFDEAIKEKLSTFECKSIEGGNTTIIHVFNFFK